MQVELCETPPAGAPEQQACRVLDTGKDEGNAADERFSAAC